MVVLAYSDSIQYHANDLRCMETLNATPFAGVILAFHLVAVRTFWEESALSGTLD